MSTSLRHATSRLATAVRILRDAHRRHRTSYPRLVARFAHVYGPRRYSMREILKLDLLDPRFTAAWFDANISKEGQLALQRELNPRAYWMLTEDKDVFGRYCAGASLAVPRSFGTLDAPPAGAPDARLVRARESAVAVLGAVDVEAIVLKPALGVYGRSVVALTRAGDTWIDGDGHRRDPSDVPAWLASLDGYDRFVVQQRMFGHPALSALSGTRNLQTVRMVTYIRDDGHVAIGCCQLKIIGRDTLVDNYGHGQRGNLIGDIPRAGGRVLRAFRAAPDGSCEYLDAHPATGVAFNGFEIPCWSEACTLVERAALAFQPLRTIGWDVGISEDGPRLIEGNVTWDPPQRGEDVNGEILSLIRADAAKASAQQRKL